MKPRPRLIHSLASVALLCACPQQAHSHETGLSTADLKFSTNALEAELTFALHDLTVVLAHSGWSPGTNAEGPFTEKNLSAGLDRFKKLGSEALSVEFDGRRITCAAPAFTLDERDNFHLKLLFPGDRPRSLLIHAGWFPYLPPKHMQFVSVHEQDGKALGNKMLGADNFTFHLDVPAVGPSGPNEPVVSTFPGFFFLGVKHIWTGYDHLLFLAALLLVCRDFKAAFQVVTCFTLAHSLTLALATLNLVWASTRLVEPAIAASIVYIGAENLLRPEGPKGRWLLTFMFGLIHGLGFASVLKDMGVASSTTGVMMPLIGFNLGVETGQIVVAGLLLPLIWRLRLWEPFLKRGIPACSAAVAIAGCYWLTQRIWFA